MIAALWVFAAICAIVAAFLLWMAWFIRIAEDDLEVPAMQMTDGGRTFDSAVHEAPTTAPRLPPTFQPTYEIEHAKVTTHVTPLGWVLGFITICSFVWAALAFYNPNH